MSIPSYHDFVENAKEYFTSNNPGEQFPLNDAYMKSLYDKLISTWDIRAEISQALTADILL